MISPTWRPLMRMPDVLLLAVALLLLSLVPAASPAEEDKPLLKPTNLPFNTAADEDDPHAADNGQTLYYTSNGMGKEDIFFVRRKPKGMAWQTKGKVVEDWVSTTVDDRSVFAT